MEMVIVGIELNFQLNGLNSCLPWLNKVVDDQLVGEAAVAESMEVAILEILERQNRNSELKSSWTLSSLRTLSSL